MKILYINNDGGGFADHIDVPEGQTVEQLFQDKVPAGRPQDYLIRVNRQPAAADQVLQNQDRVSFTPTKIEGAAARPAIRSRLMSQSGGPARRSRRWYQFSRQRRS